MGEVGAVAAQAAFADEHGEFGGGEGIVFGGGGDDHVGEARVQRQAGEGLAGWA